MAMARPRPAHTILNAKNIENDLTHRNPYVKATARFAYGAALGLEHSEQQPNFVA